MSRWYVSRQRYWPEGTPIVEVASGGLDYANPDMLVSKYPGEAEEYTDPREAVAAAIAVCKAWRADGEKRAKVAHGATGGFTMPFEGCTYREAERWARETYARLPKCDRCGEIRPSDKDAWRLLDDWSGERFCSEQCAELAFEDDERFNAEEAESEVEA